MKTANRPSFLVGLPSEDLDDPVESLGLGLVDQIDEPRFLRRSGDHASGQDLGHLMVRIPGGHQVAQKLEGLGRRENGDVSGGQSGGTGWVGVAEVSDLCLDFGRCGSAVDSGRGGGARAEMTRRRSSPWWCASRSWRGRNRIPDITLDVIGAFVYTSAIKSHRRKKLHGQSRRKPGRGVR